MRERERENQRHTLESQRVLEEDNDEDRERIAVEVRTTVGWILQKLEQRDESKRMKR